MYFQLAWRNIWRNPRRTSVIMIAIIIGVWTMISMTSLMRGMADSMVRNSVATLTGEIQIHHKGYRGDPVIENSITDPEMVEDTLRRVLEPGTLRASRVRVNAIASNARHSSGVTLVGIQPDQEAKVSFIGNEAVTEGRYLRADDVYGIVAGKALVDKFETKLGRKLVLMSQDSEKEIASKAFRIVGIFRAEMEATEKHFVFVNMPVAQQMLKLKKGMSEISLLLPDRNNADKVAADLKAALPDNYEIHTWKELLHAITAYLELFDSFMVLWYLVIFIAMGFGIVNTLLMAVFERMREFGVLKALGMKPGRIIREVLTESSFLLIIGMIVGNILGLLTIFFLSGNGIDLSSFAAGAEFAGISRIIYPVIQIRDLIISNMVVFVLGFLVSIYPAAKAARFTPVEAMARN
ncbi:ABC transporter permease [Desulfococcaceae bacterium HSG8]|nr:ABC transporter permease [Desulfococcaceae bacterium HSG8]